MVTPGASTPCWVGSISGEAAAAALWVGCGAKLKAGAVAWPAAPPKREGVPPGAVPAAPNSDKPPLGAGAENLQGGGGDSGAGSVEDAAALHQTMPRAQNSWIIGSRSGRRGTHPNPVAAAVAGAWAPNPEKAVGAAGSESGNTRVIRGSDSSGAHEVSLICCK